MRVALQSAFVLHRRPYRETSLLLDIFSQEYGRISLIAKGIRGNRSSTKALLQPFVPLFISWQGKSELMTLTSVEPDGIPLMLQGDCLLAAFYLNELINHLVTKHDPHPKLFDVYRATLMALQSHPLQESILRIFEKKILEELGYGLHLVAEPNDYYRFLPEQGFVKCNIDINQQDTSVFAGSSLLALASEDLSDEAALKDAKRLMRLAFRPLLAGNTLNSRVLFIEKNSTIDKM